MNSRSGSSSQPLRSMNMPPYNAPATSRPAPRLTNTTKSVLGNGTSWGGFGMPTSSTASFGAPGFAPAQARPGQLSGFAQVMGGGVGSAQGPIDMSDFPSLSGGPRGTQQAPATANWSTAIRAPSAPQQQQQQRTPSASNEHYPQPPERAGSGEDFPPLGDGSANGTSFNSPDLQPRTSQTQTQTSFSQQRTTKPYGSMTESEKWGLPGLMAAFESRKSVEGGGPADETLPPGMRSAGFFGQDLNSLGLDLDSPDPLYPTFHPFQAVGSSGSTFDFHDRYTIPDFTLPNAYTVTNVPPLASRMTSFSDETLFSIFYQHVRDLNQELAAHELINRDWRWHKVLRQWLQKDTREANAAAGPTLVDVTNGAPIGVQPVRKSERVEQGVYIFFDAMNWRRERRWLDLDYESLDPPRLAAGAMPGVAGIGMGAGNMPGFGGGSSQVGSA